MNTISWEEFRDSYHAERPMAATIGVFDGLHLGHTSLISRVRAKADSRLPTAFTFSANPKKKLRRSSYHGDLASLGQKLDGLSAAGIELCVLIDFSGNFSKLAGREFLSLLHERGGLSYLAIGADFRCGHRLDMDAEAVQALYEPLGIETDIVEHVQWNGHPVSSSRIRTAILEGKLEMAAAMLGRPYDVDFRGEPFSITSDGRMCYAYPTGRVLPPEGCYQVEARFRRGKRKVELEIAAGELVLDFLDTEGPETIAILQLTKRM